LHFEAEILEYHWDFMGFDIYRIFIGFIGKFGSIYRFYRKKKFREK